MRFCRGHTPLPLFSQINANFGLRIKMAYVSRESSEVAIDRVQSIATRDA